MTVDRLVLKRAVPGEQQAAQRSSHPQGQILEEPGQQQEAAVQRERYAERRKLEAPSARLWFNVLRNGSLCCLKHERSLADSPQVFFWHTRPRPAISVANFRCVI